MRDLRPHPLQLVISISLLAACANATQPSAHGDADEASAPQSEALTRAVRPGRPVELSLQVEPLAACHLRAADAPRSTKGLSVVASEQGSVHFFVKRDAHTQTADRFTLDCTTDEHNVSRTLSITSDESTSALPSVARVMPRNGTPRPALTGDLQRFTAAELHALRFPPRPDATKNPDGYQRWLQIVSHDSVVVDAHPVRAIGEQNNDNDDHFAGFTTWTNANYTRVLATWTVPEVFNTGEDTASSIWVGLYDDATNALIQNGTRQNVVQSGGSAFSSYYAWSEYYGQNENNGEQMLANFPVNPGDVITCETWTGDSGGYEQPSGQVAWFYFDNLTAGFATYNSIFPQAAPSFSGAAAEWITERPGLVGAPEPLAEFSAFTMSNAEASDTASGVHGFLDAGSLQHWDMTAGGVPSGAPLALAVAEASYGGNAESIDFAWHASE